MFVWPSGFLEAWGTKAKQPHVFRKRLVIWTCQQTVMFMKMCGFWPWYLRPPKKHCGIPLTSDGTTSQNGTWPSRGPSVDGGGDLGRPAPTDDDRRRRTAADTTTTRGRGPASLAGIGESTHDAVAVSEVFFTLSRPANDQGKTNGTGTRGNRPGGPEDQGKPRKRAKTMRNIHVYIYPAKTCHNHAKYTFLYLSSKNMSQPCKHIHFYIYPDSHYDEPHKNTFVSNGNWPSPQKLRTDGAPARPAGPAGGSGGGPAGGLGGRAGARPGVFTLGLRRNTWFWGRPEIVDLWGLGGLGGP